MDNNSNQNKIIFNTIDGEEIELYVVEQTMLNGTNYLLVADGPEDTQEANAMILKEVSYDDDTSVYEEIEDEVELDAVANVFSEIMEDIDIEFE